MAMADETRSEVERRTERWFVRQGIPHFIERYNALNDIFTRAAGFLYVVFILQILNGMNLDWPWWANVLALVASTVIMFGGVVLLNRARGRPWYRRPDRIGPIELAAFVFLPAVLPVLFGNQLASAGGIVLGNLLLLAATYVLVSYGLFSILRWAVAQTFRQVADVVNVMMRTLPLLLLFTMFMFLNAELWEVVDEIPPDFFVVSVGMLVALGSVLLAVQLPSELGHVARFDTWAEVDELVAGTPVEAVGIDGLADPPDAPAPTRRARANVGLLLYFGQAMQVLVVSLVIGLFYFAFGLVTVSETTIQLWTDRSDLDVVAHWSILGQDVAVTANLIRASIFVAGIAGLQFVVSALRDETYRAEFARDVIGDLRRVFAVRALYLARVADGDRPPALTDS
jgi:hypothetical protein